MSALSSSPSTKEADNKIIHIRIIALFKLTQPSIVRRVKDSEEMEGLEYVFSKENRRSSSSYVEGRQRSREKR